MKDKAAASTGAFEHGKAGESYNIGTGITTSCNEIAEMVKMVSKSNSKITQVMNPFKNYQMFTQADMAKTTSELEFKPSNSLNCVE